MRTRTKLKIRACIAVASLRPTHAPEAGRQTDIQTHRQTDTQTYRKKQIQTNKRGLQSDRYTEGHTERQKNSQKVRHTQTRQSVQTNTDRHTGR